MGKQLLNNTINRIIFIPTDFQIMYINFGIVVLIIYEENF